MMLCMQRVHLVLLSLLLLPRTPLAASVEFKSFMFDTRCDEPAEAGDEQHTMEFNNLMIDKHCWVYQGRYKWSEGRTKVAFKVLSCKGDEAKVMLKIRSSKEAVDCEMG